MSSILIVHLDKVPQEKQIDISLVYKFSKVIHTNTISQAEEYIDAELFDIISIHSTTVNKEILSFLKNASNQTSSGILFFTNQIEIIDKKDLENFGIFVLQDLVERDSLSSLITIILSNKKRLLKTENEYQSLQNSIEEEKLISRAKCILIQYLNMTESQAHKYIEKQSMNLRQSKASTAESILKTYES